MSALSKLLNEANDLHWSSRAIARRATEAGHPIGHDAVSKYMAGKRHRPSEATLQAFHAAFPALPLERLREAAGLPVEVTAADLPAEVSRLTPRQWAAVRELILSMVHPEGREPRSADQEFVDRFEDELQKRLAVSDTPDA